MEGFTLGVKGGRGLVAEGGAGGHWLLAVGCWLLFGWFSCGAGGNMVEWGAIFERRALVMETEQELKEEAAEMDVLGAAGVFSPGADRDAEAERLWDEFVYTARLPEGVKFPEGSPELEEARRMLSAKGPAILRFAAGETLMESGAALEGRAALDHLNALYWVELQIGNLEIDEDLKEDMRAGAQEYRGGSRNPMMGLSEGFRKGGRMLMATDAARRGGVAQKLCERLLAVNDENPLAAECEDFTRLGIAVAWELSHAGLDRELASLVNVLPVDSESTYVQKQLDRLAVRLAYNSEQPVRDWMADVSHLEGSVSHEAAFSLVRRLGGLVGTGSWFREKDEGTYDVRAAAFAKLAKFLKPVRTRMRFDLADQVLALFRKDGLESLGPKFYERKPRRHLQTEDVGRIRKPNWPSLLEDIAVLLTAAAGASYSESRKLPPPDGKEEMLEWARGKVAHAQESFPDDEWMNLRIGKLLLLEGKAEEAKERIMPIIRKKPAQFWAWDMLGKLEPEKRKCCVAKALTCKTEDQFAAKLRKEAAELGIDALGPEELKALTAEAEKLLLGGREPEAAVLVKRYATKRGDVVCEFADAKGTIYAPVWENRMKELRGAPLGTPVRLWWEDDTMGESDEGGMGEVGEEDVPPNMVKIVKMEARPDGEPWDSLKPERAVIAAAVRGSASGKDFYIVADARGGTSLVDIVPGEPGFEPGDGVMAYFRATLRKGNRSDCVRVAPPAEGEKFSYADVLPEAVVEYSGDAGRVRVFRNETMCFKVWPGQFEAPEGLAPGDRFAFRYATKYKNGELRHEMFAWRELD